jgi:hypothetical protein
MFVFENCKCLIWIPFDDDDDDDVVVVDENKSFPSVVMVRSKSYIDSDWIGAWIFCKLLRNSALVIPGHSRKSPENNKEYSGKCVFD